MRGGRLRLPGRPPRQLSLSVAMVPLDVAPKLALGMTIPVRGAPDNPGTLMFEWERLPA